MPKGNNKKVKEVVSNESETIKINTEEYGEVIIEKESIVIDDEVKNDFEELTIVDDKMTIEAFLSQHFLSNGKRLFFEKTFGKDREKKLSFEEWSKITGLV